ncbi:MAG: DUF1850 domain-containing protein [Natronospirillum sp.]|uniref:DUF1850 domain-containing protein n=1 Tax=Natronospirillum sp. TaxID=2812955 RepID=UPI0025FDEE3B|nr:DUF1850 domain-containing protein [Natronospirillum sp.]MCH8551405.1 DUF1850 domain-containing protein [Natronospirillum sp.]
MPLIPLRLTGILLGLLLPWVAAAHNAVYYLDIHRAGESERVAQVPLDADGDWCLHWHHSVTGFLVRDCFTVEEGRLMLQRSHQPDFAAGLDHIPERGDLESDGNGGYIINNINEPVAGNALRLRVGSERVGHRIVSAQQDLDLSQHFSGERLELRLRGHP